VKDHDPSHRRVLLLDDDPTTLLLLSEHLKGYGLDVVTCRELEAAEAVVEHVRPDVVVTDLCLSELGGLDGTRLVRHVAACFPRTRLFVLSGHVTPGVRRLLASLGAEVFDKPVDPKRLALRILEGAPGAGASSAGVVEALEPLDDFLAAGDVHAVLQPIVDLSRGTPPFPVLGFEALARGPEESVLRNPEILFDYALRKERLYETDLLCIRAALAEARLLGGRYRLFLNVQPRSLAHPRFADEVVRLVERSGFAPEGIVLELTEQGTILNAPAFAEALAEARRRGFQVAMDDYGLGHSNQHFLLEFKPDYVKLAGYFCRGIERDAAKQEVVRSTARMLQKLRIPAIMECLETREELEAVRRLGVKYGQGYHFSRPLRAEGLRRAGALSRRASSPVSC
jgi:EAL domain-containing protein (putative c-di-GMP-specific phosphodiesterase class I)